MIGGRLRDLNLLVECAIAREVVLAAGRQLHRAQPGRDAVKRDPGIGQDGEAHWPRDAEVSRIGVDRTGHPSSSTISRSSVFALARSTPLPEITTGRSAEASSSAASDSCASEACRGRPLG
jgi:hypothetical protein